MRQSLHAAVIFSIAGGIGTATAAVAGSLCTSGEPAVRSSTAPRYAIDDALVWYRDGSLDDPELARAANMTYSFPADGVEWGDPDDDRAPNSLNNALFREFGAEDIDLGYEHIRQGLASWARLLALNYREVPDDGRPVDEGLAKDTIPLFGIDPLIGDIRIGGYRFGPSSNSFGFDGFPDPATTTGGFGGSDMTLNTAMFTHANGHNRAYFTGCDYRVLRNIVVHEHGHGLGVLHTPVAGGPYYGQVMESPNPSALEDNAVFRLNGVQLDDVRAGMRNYGDRIINSAVSPHHLGSLPGATPPYPWLGLDWVSLNGESDEPGGHEDWYSFTVTTASTINISAFPTFSGNTWNVNTNPAPDPTGLADMAGQLHIELIDANTMMAVDAASAGSPGDAAELDSVSLAAGDYFLVVTDEGSADAEDAGYVQTYGLRVQTYSNGLVLPLTLASAGIDKVVEVGDVCHFIGDVNSFTTVQTQPITSWSWDLDGDTIEDDDDPRTSTIYTTTGFKTVTLTTECSFMVGMTTFTSTDSDTISVRVVPARFKALGAIPDVAEVGGSAVSTTIYGRRLDEVVDIEVGTWDSNFDFVEDTAITVGGTWSASMDGRELSGVTLTAGGGASTGFRTIRIVSSSEEAFAVDAFEIVPPSAPISGGGPNYDTLEKIIASMGTPCDRRGARTLTHERGSLSNDCSWSAPDLSHDPCDLDLNGDQVIDADDLATALRRLANR